MRCVLGGRYSKEPEQWAKVLGVWETYVLERLPDGRPMGCDVDQGGGGLGEKFKGKNCARDR